MFNPDIPSKKPGQNREPNREVRGASPAVLFSIKAELESDLRTIGSEPEAFRTGEKLLKQMEVLLSPFDEAKQYALWTSFRMLHGETPYQRAHFLESRFGSESLMTKFAKSIERCVGRGEKLPSLLVGLHQDREQSQLMNIEDSVIEDKMLKAFSLNRSDFRVVKGLTLSDQNSFVDRSKLGIAYSVLDERSQVLLKLRITEQIDLAREEKEWNIGVVSRDPTKKIKQGERSKIPGTKHRSYSSMINYRKLMSLKEFASELGVKRLDPLPSLYFIYKALERFGGYFDPLHPRYLEDKGRVEVIETQLEKMGIKGVSEQTWAIYQGRVIDPKTGKPGLLWKNPRFVVAIN